MVALAVRGVESFGGGLADVLASGLGHRGEEPEQQASWTAGSYPRKGSSSMSKRLATRPSPSAETCTGCGWPASSTRRTRSSSAGHRHLTPTHSHSTKPFSRFTSFRRAARMWARLTNRCRTLRRVASPAGQRDPLDPHVRAQAEQAQQQPAPRPDDRHPARRALRQSGLEAVQQGAELVHLRQQARQARRPGSAAPVLFRSRTTSSSRSVPTSIRS